MKADIARKILVFLLAFIMLLSNMVYAAPGDNTGTTLTDKEITQKIDEYLGILSKDDLFRGVVLITKDGRTMYEKAYGEASEEYKVPNNINTKFEIGSLTKQFTAAAVLMLAQQNKLSTADKLSKYIPDYPNGDKITIDNLLAQNSGIAEHVSEMDTNPDFNYTKRYKPEDIIELFKNKPLNFQPGEKFEYSNSNYILLGYIIEKVSGSSWAQFVSANIIKPLGLTNTGFVDRSKIVEGLAEGYTIGEDDLERSRYLDGSFPYAAGQMYSTAHDLAKWTEALFSDKVLNKEYTEIMLSKQVQLPDSPLYYGYGLFKHNANGRDVVWHDGSTFGFYSCMLRYVDEKTNIVVLTNNDCVNASNVLSMVGDIYFGNEYQMPKPLNLRNLNANEMPPFIGSYASEDGQFKFSIVKENDSLYIVSDMFGKGKLYSSANDLLYWKKMSIGIEFQDMKDNAYTKMIIDGGLELKRVN